MSCNGLRQNRRKGMVVSVTVLGLALFTFFLAYIAFGDASARSDPATVRYVAIVSSNRIRFKVTTSSTWLLLFPKDSKTR